MLQQSEIREAVRQVSGRYPLRSVRLFGSHAEGSATPGSDVDLLVEFEQPSVSLITLSLLKCDLEDRLGRSVDILHAPLPEDAMIEPGKTVTLYEA